MDQSTNKNESSNLHKQNKIAIYIIILVILTILGIYLLKHINYNLLKNKYIIPTIKQNNINYDMVKYISKDNCHSYKYKNYCGKGALDGEDCGFYKSKKISNCNYYKYAIYEDIYSFNIYLKENSNNYNIYNFSEYLNDFNNMKSYLKNNLNYSYKNIEYDYDYEGPENTFKIYVNVDINENLKDIVSEKFITSIMNLDNNYNNGIDKYKFKFVFKDKYILKIEYNNKILISPNDNRYRFPDKYEFEKKYKFTENGAMPAEKMTYAQVAKEIEEFIKNDK